MEYTVLTPRKSLNKAFLKVKPGRPEVERFKAELATLLERINPAESEEFHKNLLSDFLKKTGYDSDYFINTKGRNDLVIHNGNSAKTPVGVIIEAKNPSNQNEMMRLDRINVKALQELLLYYLRERITNNNLEIRHLIVTNVHEWFIFDAQVFEQCFAKNKELVRIFQGFDEGRLAGTNTEFFYKKVAPHYINAALSNLTFTYIDLQKEAKLLANESAQADSKLIPLFKVLLPEHLLKLPFTNDSNTLDKRFYTELLHIIGLTERKEKGKKLIERKPDGERNDGSLLENAIIQLDSLDKISRMEKPQQFGADKSERLFNVALELAITWTNRVLFLKLLEAQLISYHKGDRSYAFLNLEKVGSYDDLNSLFFEVLARTSGERSAEMKNRFGKVPYLNSSLFEPAWIEHAGLFISQIKDRMLPIHSATVLKDKNGKKRTGELDALEYFFEFLDAYDFTADGAEEIQEDNKTLINASVLGLIFEKINGYKDGSFFTPGFITMYMCRETIRRAVVQKFNQEKGWNCETVEQLADRIEDNADTNRIINSLKICDPAVGSGHFLVSALNELIALKSELDVLCDREGKRLKNYHVEVVNDELFVTDEDGDFFEYKPKLPESQRVQEMLFHEKQTIIENCLFGVDINPNSVKICRLRLWIELLKNAYYKGEDELETLPNIDINIKCGNSLISRFALDSDLKKALKKGKWNIDGYRVAVMSYRNAESKEHKRAMEKLIEDIKGNFEAEIYSNDPRVVKLRKERGKLFELTNQTQMFELSKKEKAAWNKKVKTHTTAIEKLEAEIEAIKSNKIYENAFEWRFEFPEVLDNDGKFIGFDAVIGNPPYIQQEEFTELKPYLETYKCFSGRADLFVYFFELSINLLKASGFQSFICSNKYFRAGYGKSLRQFLTEKMQVHCLIDFGDAPVFDATAYPSVIIMQKEKQKVGSSLVGMTWAQEDRIEDFSSVFNRRKLILSTNCLDTSGWKIEQPDVLNLLDKLKDSGQTLASVVNGGIFAGIKTGFNDAFIINEDTKKNLEKVDPSSADVIKKFAKGQDVKKWSFDPSNRYIIYIPRGTDIMKYPAIGAYLLPFKERLKKRALDQKWYELQQAQVAFEKHFLAKKIVYPNVSFGPRFSLDDGSYLDMTAFGMNSDHLWLLGVLNSSSVNFFFSKLGIQRRGGYQEFKTQYVSQIPIPSATPAQQTDIEKLVEKILALKKENPDADVSALEAEIDQLVYKLYDLTDDEVKIVEG